MEGVLPICIFKYLIDVVFMWKGDFCCQFRLMLVGSGSISLLLKFICRPDSEHNSSNISFIGVTSLCGCEVNSNM